MKNFRGILISLGLTSVFAFAANPGFEQGARFEASGQYDRALAEYRAILAKEPHNAQAFYAAGAVRFKMKDYKGAIANYQLAYKFNPKMKEAYEGSAAAYEKLGDKASAAAERKKISGGKSEAPAQKSAAKSDSKFSYSSAAFLKAKNAFDAKDYKVACSAARELLQVEPGHPGAYYYAGAGRYELGEFDKAEYNLKRAFEYPALGHNAHYYLALIYQKQGKKSLEKSELELYASLSKNADAVANAKRRIAELSGEKSPAPAAPVAENVQPAKPEPVEEAKPEPIPAKPAKPVEPTIELANEAYRSGDMAKALSMYQDLSKKFRDADTRAYLLVQIGNVYRQRRDFRSAVSKYRESVELYPNSEWAIEAQRAWEDAVWQEKNADALPRKN